jgi:hypothetical protein
MLLAAVALIVVLLATRDTGTSTVHGSGVVTEQSRVLPPFDSIGHEGEVEVTVRVGGEQSVLVSADDNLLPTVQTIVHQGTLRIATPGSFETASPMTVDVTVPRLEAAIFEGTGALSVDGVDVGTFRLRHTGTGYVRVSGTAERVNARILGTGEADLAGLVARDAFARLVGTGRLTVHATRSLVAALDGTGAIVYVGNPQKVTREITGTGAIVEG